MSDVTGNAVVEGNEKQGCTLEIRCDTDGRGLSAETVARWLAGANRSGLTKAYAEKILAFKLLRKSETEKNILYAMVRFDSTANCLEAMQQIKNITIYSVCDRYTNYTQRVTYISCPCGQFKRVTLYPKDLDFISTNEVRELLRPYGEILTLEHLKTGGIRDGRVKVAMFVPAANCHPLSECDKEEKLCEKIDVQSSFYAADGRISEELVQQLWDKYGPNGSRNNVERGLTQLAIE